MKPRWTGASLLVCAFAIALLPMIANAAPLPAPVPATPTAGSTVDQPVFSWSAVNGAVHYEIEVALDDQFVTVTDPGDELAPRIVYGTTYVPTLTYTAKTHYWHVRAVAADSTPGAWSATREFIRRWTNDDEPAGTEQMTPGSRVQNVRTLTGAHNPPVKPPVNQLGVTWDPVPGATYYEVEFSTEPSFTPDQQEDVTTCYTPHAAITPYASTGGYFRRPPLSPPCDVNSLFDPEVQVGSEYFVRIRAVDEATTADYGGEPIVGMWSDQAQEPGEQKPDALSFTLGDPVEGAGSPDAPAVPLVKSQSGTDVPLLQWDPSIGQAVTHYEVSIALDRDFTNRVGSYLTRSTLLMPNEVYDDLGPNERYYWFAVPCSAGCVPERKAINHPEYVGTFAKRSEPVQGLASSAIDSRRNAVLRWGDALTAAQSLNPDFTPGGVTKYEIQFTPGLWSSATSVMTDNLAYSSAADGPLASGTYHWRVRPFDGQNVPLAWAYGSDFTVVAPEEPSASPSPSSSATQTTGPVPTYKVPDPVEGTASDIPPEKPGKPTVKRSGKRMLRVHWRASEELGEPVSAYLLYRSTNGQRFSPVKRTTAQTVRVKAKRGRTYWFYVVADSGAGRSEASATTRFVMPRQSR